MPVWSRLQIDRHARDLAAQTIHFCVLHDFSLMRMEVTTMSREIQNYRDARVKLLGEAFFMQPCFHLVSSVQHTIVVDATTVEENGRIAASGAQGQGKEAEIPPGTRLSILLHLLPSD